MHDLIFTMKAKIAIFGLLLPYLARLPGVPFKGFSWLASFFGSGFGAFLFLEAFNAVTWASILLAVNTYRHSRSAWFPIIVGFSMPALAYSTLNLASSSTSAVALIFIPIFSLPLVFLGWLAGLFYDRRQSRNSEFAPEA